MKVSPAARRLAKYKEKKKEISFATLQLDVTFCTPIMCAPSYIKLGEILLIGSKDIERKGDFGVNKGQ